MTYFIALIIFLLPSYLVRFSIFNIPTTMLEVLIYIAFIATIINYKLQIINYKLKFNQSRLKGEAEAENQNENPKVINLKPIIHNSLFIIPIILFIISGIISVVVASDKREALGLFKAYILDPILFFGIILTKFKTQIFNFKSNSNDKNSKQDEEILRYTQNDKNNNNLAIQQFNNVTILIKSLILSGVIVAIHAIWQKITGDTTVDGRVLGIFSLDPNASPNYLAFYLAPITILAFSYWLSSLALRESRRVAFRKKYPSLLNCYIVKLLHCSMVLLLFVALWFTGSRAAIGAVVVGILSFFIIKYWQIIKSKRIFVYMFICSLVLMIAVGWQMTKPDWNLSNTEGGRVTSSNNIRWEIWNTTVKDIIPHNLVWLKGVGLGNYQNHFTNLTQDRVNFPEYISPFAVTPHNIFLNIWLNLGLLGLISFIWLLILFFKFVIRSIRYSRGSELLFATMITILIQGLVDSPIWKNDLAVMFWLLLSLSLVISSINTKKQGEDQ